ncbi:MAG: nucleotide exchange factor GrpE [Dehalococcoidales bacterium]|nr:nucleotide exchange factor GrpE [Dehalococcoidales bacterium]
MTSEEKQGQPKSNPEAESIIPGTIEQALAEAVQKAAEYLDSWKRTQADFSNLRRRTEMEKQEMAKYANAQLILNLLQVLDDFERAFQNMPHKMAKAEWAEGFRMISNKLLATLETQGLKPIDAVGKPFDPTLHEACLHEKGEEGIVVKDLRRGYMLFDKVIRPTQAVVGNGEKPDKEVKQDNNHIPEKQDKP